MFITIYVYYYKTMESRLLTRLGTLRQLEIFLKVAEHSSMTRAAEELYLSHSAVSLQIRKLSEAIGLPLHEVIGKKLYLTEAGREVVATGTQIFDSIRRLDEKINNLKGLTSGRLVASDVLDGPLNSKNNSDRTGHRDLQCIDDNTQSTQGKIDRHLDLREGLARGR